MPIYINRFDRLILFIITSIFPLCDWRLVKSQMLQESAANAHAVSPVGARGLLQLMPGTASELGLKADDVFDIELNLDAGVRYLRIQYQHFPEIPSHNEKLRFALAAYNGGRGYVNRAMELSYEDEGKAEMPPGHKGATPGDWQTWDFTKDYLKSPDCLVNGRRPDWRQMIDYVEKIWAGYQRLSCTFCEGFGEVEVPQVEDRKGGNYVMGLCPECG